MVSFMFVSFVSAKPIDVKKLNGKAIGVVGELYHPNSQAVLIKRTRWTYYAVDHESFPSLVDVVHQSKFEEAQSRLVDDVVKDLSSHSLRTKKMETTDVKSDWNTKTSLDYAAMLNEYKLDGLFLLSIGATVNLFIKNENIIHAKVFASGYIDYVDQKNTTSGAFDLMYVCRQEANLPEGWNQPPDYPLVVAAIEQSSEEIRKCLLKKAFNR